jgi:TPR repeat protein/serine/threonine protein kinase
MTKIKLMGQINTYLFDPKDSSTFLGSGGMGSVYKGRGIIPEPENPKKVKEIDVAIKVLFRDLTENISHVERVKRAAEIKIKHDSLITMLDFIVQDGIYHDVSVFVEGKDLSQIIEENNAKGKIFSYEESKGIVLDVLNGLEELHKNGIIHRDIDPSNIRIYSDGNVKLSAKLMDFGVIRLTGGKTKSLTGVGTLIGKPNYSPPEQIRGEHDKINESTDLYALGITIYEMLTGRAPFEKGNEFDTMQAQVNDPLPHNTKLDDTIFDFLLKATAKQQDKRFQSVAEFRNAFNNPRERAWWKNKQIQILGALGLVTTLVGGGFLINYQHNVSLADENTKKASNFLNIAKYDSARFYYKKAKEFVHDDSTNIKVEMLDALIPALDDMYKAKYKEAFLKLKKASELGSGDALYYLGELKYNGLGTTKDFREGWQYANSALKKGFGMANWRIASCYENGLGVKKDAKMAAKYYLLSTEPIRKLADSGDPEGLANLGGMYSSGNGLPKNESLGLEYYLKSAKKGYAFVQQNLASMYRYGSGTPVNLSEAVKWYSTSANLGHPGSQYELGKMYLYAEGVKQDTKMGLDLLNKAANQNYSEALSYLGYLYFMGKFVNVDYKKSFEFTRKAVEFGIDNIVAIENLAYDYKMGAGVNKSFSEAEKYYLKAIQQDSSRAGVDFYNIAILYLKGGYGLNQDETLYIRYAELASSYGNSIAQKDLGFIYYNKGVMAYRDELYERAREYFNKSISKGNINAKKAIAIMNQNRK